MNKLPGAIVIVDVKKESIAVDEARKIVDSDFCNCRY